MVVLNGNLRVQFESPNEQFEPIVQRAHQLNEDSGANVIDSAVSYINTEKHGSAVIEDETGAVEPEPEKTIEITSGVNGTFVSRHSLAMTSNYTTYTIGLDGRVYTTDELVAAMDAAIETQGSVANTISTSIAYIDDRFLIRCPAHLEHPYGIEIYTLHATARLR